MSRKTLKEQITEAKRAYIFPVGKDSRHSMNDRYCVYLDRGEGLEVLWPHNSHDIKLSKQEMKEAKLYAMIATSRKSLPHFHFLLTGCGYNKTHDIGMSLRETNPTIEVFALNEMGYMPSNVSLA